MTNSLFISYILSKKFFWIKKLLKANYGPLTNKPTLSINYWLIKNLNLRFSLNHKKIINKISLKNPPELIRPVQIVITTSKSKLNNLLFIYLLYMLKPWYLSYVNSWDMSYIFIFNSENLKYIPFLNSFFFKLRNH